MPGTVVPEGNLPPASSTLSGPTIFVNTNHPSKTWNGTGVVDQPKPDTYGGEHWVDPASITSAMPAFDGAYVDATGSSTLSRPLECYPGPTAPVAVTDLLELEASTFIHPLGASTAFTNSSIIHHDGPRGTEGTGGAGGNADQRTETPPRSDPENRIATAPRAEFGGMLTPLALPRMHESTRLTSASTSAWVAGL